MNDTETQSIINDHIHAKARISTLECMREEEVLSRCIVPCIAHFRDYYNDDNVGADDNNNGRRTFNVVHPRNTDDDENASGGKNKRKRDPVLVDEFCKKFKLIPKDDKTEYGVVGEGGVTIIQLTTTTLKDPDWSALHNCRMCNKPKVVKKFGFLSKDKRVSYKEPVCTTCKTKWIKWDKSRK